MNGRIAYRQQFTRCGKQRCRKCKEGEGHGPYWYAYWSENGRTKTRYIGVRLPPDLELAQPALTGAEENATHSLLAPTTPTPVLRVYLLGQFYVEYKSGNEWCSVDSQVWQHRRARSLLGCLLSSPHRRLSREQVMKLLWPDLARDIAANRLNGAVHELRHILEPGIARPGASRMLRIERDMLELADSSQIWVDADAFEHLLHEANATTDAGQAEHLLEEADALYKSSYLLEELYSEWTSQRRDALQQKWTEMLLTLANLRAERGALVDAIAILDRLRSTDPLNELALQRLMVLLTQLQRRGEALRIYRQHVNTLKREYECDPLPETRTLYNALRQGHIPPAYLVQTGKTRTRTAEIASPGSQAGQEAMFVRPPLQLDRHHPQPLIGRQQELDGMRRILQAASSPSAAKHPHFLLLTGEAGIGKTRLAGELSIEAYTQGWAVVWNKANEGLELLSTLCQPLLLILDDLQWTDEANIDLLGYLIHHLQEQRILLLATCRDEDLAQAQKFHMLITDLRRKQVLVTLPVPPLSTTEIGTLLAHLVCGQGEQIPAEIAQSIQAQAAGNPFFAQELARLAGQNLSQAVYPLPETITALFERRLHKLSPGCQTCLGEAALLGEAFELGRLLSSMHRYAEEDIFDQLEEALHAKLLREEGTAAHIIYHFYHPLFATFLRERHSASPHV